MHCQYFLYFTNMYHISYFKESDQAVVLDFMKANPFITLCGADANGKPVATHIPVMIMEREGKLFLQGHIMRKQDHTHAFEKNNEVLAIFHGPHTYVSASWYNPNNIGSTWNYMVAHARGKMNFQDDAFLLSLLTRLTEKFENNPDSPSLVQKLPKEYVSDMMKAIVGFEIEVESIENVFKLSQNRNKESYDNIIDKLEDKDDGARNIAEEMKKRSGNIKDS